MFLDSRIGGAGARPHSCIPQTSVFPHGPVFRVRQMLALPWQLPKHVQRSSLHVLPRPTLPL
jgi:hypothetical protein